jgi:hypothetical protein
VTATVTGSLGRTGPRKARPAQSRVARRAIQDGFGTGKAPGVGQGHPLVGRPLGRGGGRDFLSSFPSLSFLPFFLSFPPCLALSRETRLRFLPAGHLWRSRPPAGRGVGSRWLCSTGRPRRRIQMALLDRPGADRVASPVGRRGRVGIRTGSPRAELDPRAGDF